MTNKNTAEADKFHWRIFIIYPNVCSWTLVFSIVDQQRFFWFINWFSLWLSCWLCHTPQETLSRNLIPSSSYRTDYDQTSSWNPPCLDNCLHTASEIYTWKTFLRIYIIIKKCTSCSIIVFITYMYRYIYQVHIIG